MSIVANKNNLSPEQILLKMYAWCAYQERSQFETYKKIICYNAEPTMANQIIAKLIEENYLNEERFALAFASGKFKIKQWGKLKIKLELKLHKVNDYLINKALNQINDSDYIETFTKLTEKKLRTTKEKDLRIKYYKTMQYLMSRGFEADFVNDNLKTILQH